MDLSEIWEKLRRNLVKIEAKFRQIWLDLGKIKILHPKSIRSSTAMYPSFWKALLRTFKNAKHVNREPKSWKWRPLCCLALLGKKIVTACVLKHLSAAVRGRTLIFITNRILVCCSKFVLAIFVHVNRLPWNCKISVRFFRPAVLNKKMSESVSLWFISVRFYSIPKQLHIYWLRGRMGKHRFYSNNQGRSKVIQCCLVYTKN